MSYVFPNTFRIKWGNPCRFESCSRHHSLIFNELGAKKA